MDEKLKSEQIIISAPMSFHGSAARIWKITDTKSAGKKVLFVSIALFSILFAWFAVLIWYIVFGILLVPFRLIRRGQRKRKMESLRHRELLSAVEKR
jgi:hypothetical protein